MLRTHTEEFYEVTNANFNILEIDQALLKWENASYYSPSSGMGYLTQQEFLEHYQQNQGKEQISPIT